MTFGEKMRALMTERGIGVRKLARAVPCDPSHISKMSRGLDHPSGRMAGRIDAVLGADGELYALWEPAPYLSPDDEDRVVRAARRPSRLDVRVVESLAVILAEWRRTEDAIGSEPLVDPVRAQLSTIERLVIDARGPVRPKIVDVAGQWAQFAGWLDISSGRLTRARRWYDRASEWATEVANHDLAANIMSFRGHLAWLAGHPGPTIGLSEAAQRMRGIYPGQVVYDALQEARGHAMIGEARDADAALGRASDLIDDMSNWHDRIPPWSYYYSTPLYTLERGLVYRLLGATARPVFNRRAIDTIGEGLRSLPAEMRGSEWAGEFAYQLGRAHLQDREREPAAELGDELAALAEQTGSKRLARQAAALR